jgi:hypothetical protein
VRVLLPVAVVLAAAGIGIAGYLTVVHYAHQPIACSSIGDCELVNSSKYAKLAGVPVAVLGLLSYVTMLLLVAAAWLGVAALARAPGVALLYALACVATRRDGGAAGGAVVCGFGGGLRGGEPQIAEQMEVARRICPGAAWRRRSRLRRSERCGIGGGSA